MLPFPTIEQTLDQLHEALRDYIEATYHVGHPQLIHQRSALMDEIGTIRQVPYLESTPRYQLGRALGEMGLPEAAEAILTILSQEPRVVHNPPYEHQDKALTQSLNAGRSLIVVTGTGSGKTECFLLPILGKLAREAKEKPEVFGRSPGMRAILLYPMNALVNDQLGRLRLMFGDPRVSKQFIQWSGRPARFARYTSRTLYPGVRTSLRDQERLKPIRRYYVGLLKAAQDSDSYKAGAATALVAELRKRGKWPAKPDLQQWYGMDGARWVNKQGEFQRCVLLGEDPEVLTRHEALDWPPDILVTNYSMLEYMLMRPIERPIFDKTREWLQDNPGEKLLLVVDEAHLYRGAAGAEVALLLRRLRARLGVGPERIQVICTSASFNDIEAAQRFAAQLTGKQPADFDPIRGNLDLRPVASPGTSDDAELLSAIDLSGFYQANSDAGRLEIIRPFIESRGVKGNLTLGPALYAALHDYHVLGELINCTMREAYPLNELASRLFPDVEADKAKAGLTALVSLGSLARRTADEPGLLPCRVHSFHRGLPGLWVCVDPTCSDLPIEQQIGPSGKMYSQPRESCTCGARVFELFTCRNCGTAYCRAYTDNLEQPGYLWGEPGGAARTAAGEMSELLPLDLLLEEPIDDHVVVAELDLITGRLDPEYQGERRRTVYLSPYLPPGADGEAASGRPFLPCGVCQQTPRYGRSSVQDHQTKGDQPFQALVSRQLQVQPPAAQPATAFAPLRGRKVLLFSDSRQTAARLAANIQGYSFRDSLRPLLVAGFKTLQDDHGLAKRLTLQDIYCSVLLASVRLEVRLRPELREGEGMDAAFAKVEQFVASCKSGNQPDARDLTDEIRGETPPLSMLEAILDAFTDAYYGLESLALGTLVERHTHQVAIEGLPTITNIATTPEQKRALARAWLRCWLRRGIWMTHMPQDWWGVHVMGHRGNFSSLARFLGPTGNRAFLDQWLPKLLSIFAEPQGANKYRLKANELSLEVGGDWAYCSACRTTQRPFPGLVRCIACAKETVATIDPDKHTVFRARKGYYRRATLQAMQDPPIPPMAFIAAEHTAQLNTAQANDVFSKAEEHELLFQDIAIQSLNEGRGDPAIDVLSCTTTMEVGIDIGALSGVALRNMPPARANYQQRAGRAGRRGNAVATVVAFGSVDSHDEHCFQHPDQMIRGPVDDPLLSLGNVDIARRHVTAYLLQRYHQDRLPNISPEDYSPQLFAVLGTVAEFMSETAPLNRRDFGEWLVVGEQLLREEVASWIPDELSEAQTLHLLDTLVASTLEVIDHALGVTHIVHEESADPGMETGGAASDAAAGTEPTVEIIPEVDNATSAGATQAAMSNLLDRLLYKGVLPRYAFPTDVATFHVFDRDGSTRRRPVFQYTPSQGLSAALSQYAPGREVWIDRKLWRSEAIYSPFKGDRFEAWKGRLLYYECAACGYSDTRELAEGDLDDLLDCEACGGQSTVGARRWLRPPGFAHPVDRPPGTSSDDSPERSYATRARLTAPTPIETAAWHDIVPRVRVYSGRERLLVTNRGPRELGYDYCTTCGRIEAAANRHHQTWSAHNKPYPDEREPGCPEARTARGIVLGTDFITDVLLLSLRVDPPTRLRPDILATKVALRTICEALVKASTSELGLEPTELEADFRPALTPQGILGMEAEIYLYDTLAGGAGFARRVGEVANAVMERALAILEQCPADCDSSCYRCLRKFGNRLEHALLDRHLGASLLRHLATGATLTLPDDRLDRTYSLLVEDLQRNGSDRFSIERHVAVQVAGLGAVEVPILLTTTTGARWVLDLHHPLVPGIALKPQVNDLAELQTVIPTLLVDELLVRRNLPRATANLLELIG